MAFLPSFNRAAWWPLSVSWESSHIPSHRLALSFSGSNGGERADRDSIDNTTHYNLIRFGTITTSNR